MAQGKRAEVSGGAAGRDLAALECAGQSLHEIGRAFGRTHTSGWDSSAVVASWRDSPGGSSARRRQALQAHP